jgi:hypothetical protein
VADARITGGADLYRIARQVRKSASDPEVAKQFNKAVKGSTKPAQNRIKQGLGEYMPTGYVPDLRRDLSVRSGTTLSGRRAGVRVEARSRQSRLGALNAGRLRHPLFGNRDHWFTQAVRPGFFTDPLRAAVPAVKAAVERAVQEALDQIR